MATKRKTKPKTQKKAVPEVGPRHPQFELVRQLAELRENIYLYGPAGAGKSFLSRSIAETLGLQFYGMALCEESSKADIVGYFSPHSGEIVRTPFRRAYEDGGVMLFDEYDAASPNIQLVLNEGLEGGSMFFPDGVIEKHKDFVCLVTANTTGSGPTSAYLGRNPIDGANKDRYAYVSVCIDEEFEKILAEDAGWTAWVQNVRHAVEELGITALVVTPRASIKGSRALAAGMDRAVVEDAYVWRGLDESTKARILARLPELPETEQKPEQETEQEKREQERERQLNLIRERQLKLIRERREQEQQKNLKWHQEQERLERERQEPEQEPDDGSIEARLAACLGVKVGQAGSWVRKVS